MANTKKLTRADVEALRNAVVLAAAAMPIMLRGHKTAAAAIEQARRELNHASESVQWIYRAYRAEMGFFPDEAPSGGLVAMIAARNRLRKWLSEIEG